MLATAILANLLLATAAFAAPKGRLAERVARRRAGSHLSRPLQRVEGHATNSSNTDTSSNWTGDVLVATKATYKSVTGTFIVPTPKEPSGGSSGTEYSASAWVGIDGDTAGNSILQTGLDFNVQGGQVTYDAWYEWYPDYAYDFSGISFSAGDSVTVTVTATSTTKGTAVITNNTKGKTVTKSLSSSAALQEYNAEWIVEDFEEGSSLVPLANWGTVEFTGASATTTSGTTVGPNSAGYDIIELEQNGKILSSVSVTSSTVTITYV